MVNIPNKITGDTFSADEANQIAEEIENSALSSGQSLSSGDRTQLGKALATYANKGNIYSDSGTSNTYVLNVLDSLYQVPALSTGLVVGFVTNNSNTGTSTLKLGSLLTKPIKKTDGTTDITNGTVKSNVLNYARYDSSADTGSGAWIIDDIQVLPKWFFEGFDSILAVGSNDKDVTVSPGSCKSFSNVTNIELTSTLTKQIDATWSPGTNQGGLSSALTLTADTWYHFFVIYNSATGAIDCGWDTSLNASNILTDAVGFDEYRYITSHYVYDFGAADLRIEAYSNNGDTYYHTDPTSDNTLVTSSSLILKSIKCPPDLNLNVSIYGTFGRGDSLNNDIIFAHHDSTGPFSTFTTSGNQGVGYSVSEVVTSTSSEIKVAFGQNQPTSFFLKVGNWRVNRTKI